MHAVHSLLLVVLIASSPFVGAAAAESERGDADPIGLKAEVRRAGCKVHVLKEKDVTVIDVSGAGIGSATISRQAKAWPKNMRLRLHFRGLESCKVATKDLGLEWSVSSTGKPVSRVSLRKGRKETPLDRKSPYHAEARIISNNANIPLKSGYFEIPLPPKLLDDNPTELSLRWIDFYRN